MKNCDHSKALKIIREEMHLNFVSRDQNYRLQFVNTFSKKNPQINMGGTGSKVNLYKITLVKITLKTSQHIPSG